MTPSLWPLVGSSAALNRLGRPLLFRESFHKMKIVMNKKHGEFHIIIEKDEDGYFVADVPELPGCHTQAKSLDELIKRTQEAILLCLEVSGRTKEVEFVGVQKIAV